MTEFVDKRTFLAGRLCLTQGWYARREREHPIAPGLEWKFHVGADVGRRARDWLGAGRSLPWAPVDGALSATTDAVVSDGADLIFEASFSWGALIARADAIRRGSAGWTLYEVKSGKSSADGEVKQDYVDDIGYTLLVARNAGLAVDRAKLILLNHAYTLGGEAELLVEVDVTEAALARANEFAKSAQAIARAIIAEVCPEATLKWPCKDCAYFATACIGRDIPDPLWVIPRLSQKRFEELLSYQRISNLPDHVELTERQSEIVRLIRAGAERADRVALRLLDEVVWPAHYLDFEAVMPHVPWFGGRPPYEVTPFQYSLDIVARPGSAVDHREYLAPAEGDFRRALAERLLADLGSHGSIVVYSSYERTRLKALAALFPDLAASIESVIGRIFDLERVFKDGYAHPSFLGRTSIKRVLPVLVPDLSYARLAIRGGEDAAGVFALMRVGAYGVETHAEHRGDLLEYCRMDSTGMVRLHEAVIRIREGRE